MYEAVLFDMDGVIVDTEHSVTEFWRQLAASEGFSLSTADLERHVYGNRADHTLRELFPRISPDRYGEIYGRLRRNQESLLYAAVPGVHTLLEGLGQAVVPVALVTGAQDWKAAAVLGQLGLTETFDTQICADDTALGKPHPACYLLAAERLCVDIERCLVFEDAVSGVTSAVAAGAACVGLAPPHRARQVLDAGALTVVRDFTEVVFDPRERTMSAGREELLFAPVPGGDRLPAY
ncbi:HAD family phosphatase [Sphaerisporangium sp. TRM90804]|uniref:HAD family hydrolase n=1 Tax=Sphaerisporangium sp. TRM90804 TaxID=3031113 RepID=UPI002448D326|nr:HAD family phosphatase [Sphaerisporangium sp. TRM90804]MDH2426544.1 HAD family phosphatase [Sphaerisporangium sp. TRM90804]